MPLSQAQKKLRKKKEKERKRHEREARERALNKQAPDLEKKRQEAAARRAKGKASAPKVEEHNLELASLVFQHGSGKIFIGKKSNAQDREYMTGEEGIGITHVLNCAKEIPIPEWYADAGVVCCKLECEDKMAFPIQEFFDQGVEFIREHMDNGGSLLVHCQEGRSRSCSMVVAYMIKYHNMRLDSALGTITARRSLVHPNRGFMEKLRGWEETYHPEGDAEEHVE